MTGFFCYPLPPSPISHSTPLSLCLLTTYTTPVPEMNVEKLMKMAGSVRTGGKGTMRRKKKAVHKTTTTDDKRLQSTLKRIGVNAIPAIEEVNIFKEDVVIQFTNPKVQASIAANTWVVSGTPQTKKLQDILPQIIHQLGPDNLENLKKLAEQFQKQVPIAGAGTDAGANIAQEDDDDDVPDLVDDQTFEAAAEEGHTS
ncbi:basic transcription factor 3 [Abeliophyllum distichum]|uniref:Nascent polypeptide-associated complex subunit beta n=1 Tax=Abeliophyllum distichum TaxID=126358 RepID=A0ABD1SW25_9LAMI